jgi:hypothetical protein
MQNTGKTTMVRDLLWHHQDLSAASAIVGVIDEHPRMQTLMGDDHVSDEYSAERMAAIVEQHRATGGPTVILLDNCLYESAVFDDPVMRDLFEIAETTQTCVLITMLYAMGIPQRMLNRVGRVCLFREKISANRRRLYQCYATWIPEFDIFCQVLDQCTDDYGCLVLDTRADDLPWEDRIAWAKAEMRPAFQLVAALAESDRPITDSG